NDTTVWCQSRGVTEPQRDPRRPAMFTKNLILPEFSFACVAFSQTKKMFCQCFLLLALSFSKTRKICPVLLSFAYFSFAKEK
ncbi:MAG: hypothetical protein IJW44_00845, partial [Clostridia bacterium]|nr:hypothetical protein [Clostridia bacterium]